jgi:8-oxo-dGTP pyrophosphatase MutT (NUDIX family)
MPQEKSSGILLYRLEAGERLFLVLHYGAGHWSFCKGHVEAGETERQTALRELTEETGIPASSLHFDEGFREEIAYFFKKLGAPVHKTVAFFLAQVDGNPKLALSREHTEAVWLPFEEASARLTYDSDRKVMVSGQAFLKSRG